MPLLSLKLFASALKPARRSLKTSWLENSREVFTRLQETGITPEEADDYIDQIERLLEERESTPRSGDRRAHEDDGGENRSRESSPGGGGLYENENGERNSQEETDTARRAVEAAADAAAWGIKTRCYSPYFVVRRRIRR